MTNPPHTIRWLPILTLAAIILANMGTAQADAERWKREGWRTDFSKTTIEFDEILSGGPPKDGIPAIDSPIFKPIAGITDVAKRTVPFCGVQPFVARTHPCGT